MMSLFHEKIIFKFVDLKIFRYSAIARIFVFKLIDSTEVKVGCVFLMVIIAALFHADFGRSSDDVTIGKTQLTL